MFTEYSYRILETMVEISGHCINCNRAVCFAVKKHEWEKYMAKTHLIQDALISSTANHREFLMSGLCGSCFDEWTTG